MTQRLIFGGILFVVVFFGWMSREEKKENTASIDTLADAREIISQVEGYEQEREYVDSLVEKAHEQAFQFAYKQGTIGRRWTPSEPASFKEDTYFKWLFINIASQIRGGFDSAKMPRHKPMRDLLKNLDALREELGVEGLRTG